MLKLAIRDQVQNQLLKKSTRSERMFRFFVPITASLLILSVGVATQRAHGQGDTGVEKTSKDIEPAQIPLRPVATATPKEDTPPKTKRWFARFGLVPAAYHPGATFATSGGIIPGATASASSNFTTTFEVGYDITKNISASIFSGFPPKPHIDGRGTVASLGTLGKVRYGPLIFSANYHFPKVAGFRPYVGGGAAYAIILKEFDGAVTQLNAHNNWGSVLQGGVERQLTPKLGLFVDFKEVWLSINAEGFLSGSVPVKARVKLNPSLVTTGIKFHFR